MLPPVRFSSASAHTRCTQPTWIRGAGLYQHTSQISQRIHKKHPELIWEIPATFHELWGFH